MDEDPSSKNPSAHLNSENNANNHAKGEWQLFWDALFGTEERADFLPVAMAAKKANLAQLRPLTLENVKLITKNLSQTRRRLNLKLEKIKGEIEEKTQLLENLKLVGSESEETLDRIRELTDLGQETSQQLEEMTAKLKKARVLEDKLLQEQKSQSR